MLSLSYLYYSFYYKGFTAINTGKYLGVSRKKVLREFAYISEKYGKHKQIRPQIYDKNKHELIKKILLSSGLDFHFILYFDTKNIDINKIYKDMNCPTIKYGFKDILEGMLSHDIKHEYISRLLQCSKSYVNSYSAQNKVKQKQQKESMTTEVKLFVYKLLSQKLSLWQLILLFKDYPINEVIDCYETYHNNFNKKVKCKSCGSVMYFLNNKEYYCVKCKNTLSNSKRRNLKFL